ncbi:MAG: SsrA-binding protein SmpB [Pseudomonadales bacterium]|jgi:SsrA-binding protein|nr:SsrA-binding protein SmpB [Pseudomonadales bacterium]
MILLTNKRATYDYEISKKLQAGVVLSGAEVKSLRGKSGSLAGSFVKVIDGQAVLINAQISPYSYADNKNYDPKQTRVLLLRKKEIYALEESISAKGLTAVPLSFETVKNKIKLNIGLGRGKKQFEKRAVIKDREARREISKMMKQRY